MQDERIIDLLWARKEIALQYVMAQYARYAHAISYRILCNHEDASECVNQTWLALWNSIPPHRPQVLSAFIGKLARRISFKAYRAQTAARRGGGQIPEALDELAECIPHPSDVESEMDRQALICLLNDFLSRLPADSRHVFVLRYWHLYPLSQICRQCGYSESKVKSMLFRTRQKLREELQKEGVWNE